MAPTFFIASGCPIVTTTRYRCVHLKEQLEQLGYEVELAEWFQESDIQLEPALRHDVILLYRIPFSPQLERLIGSAKQAGKRVIFDTDDLIFEPELTIWHRAVQNLTPSEQEQHLAGVRRYLQTLMACDAATVATPLLAEFAKKRGKAAFVHRNALGCEMLAWADTLYLNRKADRHGSKVIIGYGSGTATHDIDFQEASGPLANAMRRFPEVELVLVGPLTLPDELHSLRNRIRHFPLTSWRHWFELASEMDVAIAPLEMGNVFCRAKSEIKFVEAGAIGLPIVASAIDCYEKAICHGRNGFLASDSGEWEESLGTLITDAEHRRAVGEEARETVLRRYSPESRAAELADLLPKLLES